MRKRALVGGVVALLVMGAGVSGQVSQQPGPRPDGTALTQAERIAQVVEELNAQAVERKGGDLVAQSGVPGKTVGPAAVTYRVDPATRGDLLLLGCPVDVGLLHADSDARVTDVSAKLLTHPCVVSTTAIDTSVVTPTVSQLHAFDVVLVWSNFIPIDNVELGSRIADYVDAGGGVVLMVFALNGLQSGTMEGRFLSDNYYCIERNPIGVTTGAASLGAVHVPGHPVMDAVGSFDGGSFAWRSTGPLHPRATQIADWNTGDVLAASRHDLGGRRVDLNFFPGSADSTGGGWDPTTDGAQLMGNACAWAAGCPTADANPCAPSLFSQPVDPAPGSFFSNTQSNPTSITQFADDFWVQPGGLVSRITFWGTAALNGDVPPAGWSFCINIHADAIGPIPGEIIYTTNVVAKPVYTGEAQGNGIRLYRFDVELPEPFFAAPGTFYWLSILNQMDDFAWAWQQTDSPVPPGSAFRSGDNGAWTRFEGIDYAFELCGACFCDCPGDADFDGDVDLDDLQLLLFYFGTVCGVF